MTVTLLRSSPPSALPRWATPRNPDRQTLGHEVGAVAKSLGMPLMPWQQQVADVALELDEDGELHYGEVTIAVPRQSGKTSLLLAALVHRCLLFADMLGKPQRVTYTAQSGVEARIKWEREQIPMLQDSPFSSMFTVIKSNGRESFKWNNGSYHSITYSGDRAGHGQTIDVAVIDEAWSQDDAATEQALGPAMVTRTSAQLWIPSTVGHRRADSPYFWNKMELGRRTVDLGDESSIAYFEWSADPNEDPLDPEVWKGCMPALGHTISPKRIKAQAEKLPLEEFRRAYLNQWPDEAPIDWQVIERDEWLRLADENTKIQGKINLALDMTPDRKHVSLVAAGRRADGLGHVELIEHGSAATGSEWMTQRAIEIYRKHPVETVIVDAAGPANSIGKHLEAAGVDVTYSTARNMVQACGMFYDAIKGQRFRYHPGRMELTIAAAGGVKRQLSDAWAWTRRGATVDVSPLVAATLALWGVESTPAEVRYDLLGSVV